MNYSNVKYLKAKPGEQIDAQIRRYINSHKQKEVIESFFPMVYKMIKSKHINYNVEEVVSAAIFVLVQKLQDTKFLDSVEPQFFIRKLQNYILSAILGEMALLSCCVSIGHKTAGNSYYLSKVRDKLKLLYLDDTPIEIAQYKKDTSKIDEIISVLPDQLWKDALWLWGESRYPLSQKDLNKYKTLYNRYIDNRYKCFVPDNVFKISINKKKQMHFSKSCDNACTRIRKVVMQEIKRILKEKKVCMD